MINWFFAGYDVILKGLRIKMPVMQEERSFGKYPIIDDIIPRLGQLPLGVIIIFAKRRRTDSWQQ